MLSNNDISLICSDILPCIFDEHIFFPVCTDHLITYLRTQVNLTGIQAFWKSRSAVLLLCVRLYLSDIFWAGNDRKVMCACKLGSSQGCLYTVNVTLRKKLHPNIFCFLLPVWAHDGLIHWKNPHQNLLICEGLCRNDEILARPPGPREVQSYLKPKDNHTVCKTKNKLYLEV